MRNEENVKAIIRLLQTMMTRGTLEQGQAEALRRCLRELCRARRAHDPARLWAAVDQVARVFLRTGIAETSFEVVES
jgi:TorA maturation chaperone TorD